MDGHWMGCVDFRGLGDELRHVYTAPTRAEATAFARSRGWTRGIRKAATRFNRFWIIGDWVSYGQTIRCATETPGVTVLVTLRSHDPHGHTGAPQ